jgi:fructose-1,6-bisphosphatase/inositol monophosphatase family enzyme
VTDAQELALRRRVAEEAARAAGEVHHRYRGQDLQRTVHGGDLSDYATRADFEAQDAVRATVQRYFPDERVIGEEDESRDGLPELIEAGCWFTDPLDGTQDFAHGGPGYSCIVSYVEGGTPRAAAIDFEAWGEMFSAAEGAGATLNGLPIKASGQTRLESAMFATTWRGTDPARSEAFTRLVAKLMPRVEGFRMPGAPAVMAAAVACGRYDIYVHLPALIQPATPSPRPFAGQPWETAAFVLLVREAGGAVAALSGGPPDILGHNVYASSPELVAAFLEVMGGG